MDYITYTLDKHLGESYAPWMYIFDTPEKACEIINKAIKGIKDEDAECYIQEVYTEYGDKNTYIRLGIPGNIEKPYGAYGTTIDILCPDRKDQKCIRIFTIGKILTEDITREMLEIKESDKERPSKQKKEYIKRLWKLNKVILDAR